MSKPIRYCYLLFIILMSALSSKAQELPVLRSFDASQLPGKNQNWMITQGDSGKIYVANSAGIMVFNGFQWTLIHLPNESIVRSIFKSSDGCIYAGGFQTFGFIDDGDPEQISYKALSSQIPPEWIAQQEMWNVFEQDSTIYWQSFSAIYGYNSDSLFRLIPPSNIMFAQHVDTALLIPSLEQGIFQLSKRKITTISDEDYLPTGSRIAGIAQNTPSDALIIGTQDKGLFYRQNKQYFPLVSPISDMVSKDRLNRFIRLSDGTFALGTIRNGLYILDDKMQIKYHLNKSNGLPNNTVLALFEDKDQNLWIGMDKGICLLELDSPQKYYYDQAGLLGSIYACTNYDNTRYIGTNQGLFILNNKDNYELIPETQGQVWSLLQNENYLLCGHNSGTFLISNNQSTQITSNTGVWDMAIAKNGSIIQSSYTGLSILQHDDLGDFNILRLEEHPYLMQKFVLQNQELYGIHPQQGIYVLRFNSSFTDIESTLILEENQLPNVKLTDIKLINNQIFLKSDSRYFELLRETNTVIPTTLSLHEWLNIDLSLDLPDELSNEAAIPIENENDPAIVPYLFQENEGYFTLSNKIKPRRSINISVEGLSSKNKSIQDLRSISATDNDLVIKLSNDSPGLQGSIPIEYRLLAYDLTWKAMPEKGIIQARNLDQGVYQLLLRHKQNPTIEHKIIEFRVLPHWYESKIALITYSFIGLTIIMFFFRQHQKRLSRIELKLKSEQTEKLLKAQMKSRNEQLEQEVKYKSKMLANNAMTLIQKNKMLLDLKVYLKRARDEENTVEYEKIVKLINRNIKSDEDWEIFEKNFAEVHDEFLNAFQEKHPSLTSGELRLAAYIRMNLSSKEIAPLLNISVRSVENKRHRLRKKIELHSSESLNEYLMRF